MKEEPTVGSPFFGAFRSVRIPNATKDVNVYFSPLSRNSYEFWELSESTTQSIVE